METNRIVITDSGLGGLDVAARLVEALKGRILPQQTEIIFVNALPEAQRGYNKMPDTATKVHTFNRVLHGIQRVFQPRLIAIACNTLSAIVNQTGFFHRHADQVLDIIDIGVRSFLNTMRNSDQAILVLFGTETTIQSKVYQNRFADAGIANNRIIPVICPGLASQIEQNPDSAQTKNLISDCVQRALRPYLSKDQPLSLFLGCTHYGYVQKEFEQQFLSKGYQKIKTINPNIFMVETILKDYFGALRGDHRGASKAVEIRVCSKAEILPQEIDSISALIEPLSGETAKALRGYERIIDLF